MLQKLTRRQPVAVAKVYRFGYIPHNINHFLALVELQPLLAIVSETNGRTYIKTPAVGGYFTQQKTQKSTLSRAVITDDTQFLVTRKNIGEMVEYLQVMRLFRVVLSRNDKRLADLFRLKNLIAYIR